MSTSSAHKGLHSCQPAREVGSLASHNHTRHSQCSLSPQAACPWVCGHALPAKQCSLHSRRATYLAHKALLLPTLCLDHVVQPWINLKI